MGEEPGAYITLDAYRAENSLLYTKMRLAQALLERTNPDESELQIGPTYEELLALVSAYVDARVRSQGGSDIRDLAIPYWRRQLLDVLETAISQPSPDAGGHILPILGAPDTFASADVHRFQCAGLTAPGKKTHLASVACHSPLEVDFARFLDAAPDVLRYVKNERLGFAIPYQEGHRTRHYYPDFIVEVKHPTKSGQSLYLIAETKGERHPNTALKKQAAEGWATRLTATHRFGEWRYLLVNEHPFRRALSQGATTLAALLIALEARS